MNFLQKSLQVALVDKDDRIVGYEDRWEAHKKGLLHRAFTLLILYQDAVVIQHRKHIVFDNVYDTTISSHPYVLNGKLQSMDEALYDTLLREWNILPEHLVEKPGFLGKFLYKAPDPQSEFTEHEVCHVFRCTTAQLSDPIADTAYGFKTQPLDEFLTPKRMNIPFAPWVYEMDQYGLFGTTTNSI